MPEKTVARSESVPQPPAQETTREQERFVRPPVDIYETTDGLTVVADLPGVPRDGLDIQVKDNILTIQGRARQPNSASPIYREFELFSYFRQFELSDSVDVTRISAELKNGVLTLQLPKAEQAKPKQIQVQVG
jgi:HSP20 family molecular chaperone IbpA